MSERPRWLTPLHAQQDAHDAAAPTGTADLPDDELVRRVGLGDTAALEVLYSRYARVVYSFAVRIVGDGLTAEEILQEAFVRAWTQAGTFRRCAATSRVGC